MVPYSIFKSVSVYAIIFYSFCTRFCLLIFTYVSLTVFRTVAAHGWPATSSAY